MPRACARWPECDRRECRAALRSVLQVRGCFLSFQLNLFPDGK